MMKRRFVGGLIINDANEVLMLRRSSEEEFVSGLWSLPGGEVLVGENEQDALVREVKEETTLEISVDGLVYFAERATWTVAIYRCTVVVGVPVNNSPHTADELRFVSLEHIPEATVLEALIAILKFRISQKVSIASYANEIGRIFTALFYSYISPSLREFKEIYNYSIIKYTIQATPYRKFKSAIPFLLCCCDNNSLAYSILAEILFSIFIILDNVCDNKKERYGRLTALGLNGLPQNVITLFLFSTSLQALINNRQFNLVNSELVNKICFDLGVAQSKRFVNNKFHSIDDYLEFSYQRTSFLQTIWNAALADLGYHEEKELMTRIYPICAKLGQIKNDYYDIISKIDAFSDVKRGIFSYYTLLLLENISSEKEKAFFYKSIWKNKADNSLSELQILLERYHIRERMIKEILEGCKKMSIELSNCHISKEKKVILQAWIDLQFRNGIDITIDHNMKARLSVFFDAITKLTYNCA